jgi:hypothetical protein
MKHRLIQTENYLLIVSDEIPTTWYYDTYLNQIRHTGGAEYGESYITKKTIAHLPLNGAPILEGVDLLPPIEDEVEKLAQQEFDRPLIVDMGTDITPSHQQGFVVGYNKAKEKYKYTEEDMINFAIWRNITVFDSPYTPLGEFRLWESLQQPKMPVGFECEVERIYPNHQTISKEYDFDDILIERKTTTNSQGQTVWVGKYIFND